MIYTKEDFKGITLIALVITIIILLILSAITITQLVGENGLITRAKEAKKAQIEAEMQEKLMLAISELQLEKDGNVTLDDITEEFLRDKMKNDDITIVEDTSQNSITVIIKESGITGTFIIDEVLNVTKVKEGGSIKFSYDIGERNGQIVSILIHVQDEENGINRIELPGKDAVMANGDKTELSIDYEVEIGKEYKITIISANGYKKDEVILIDKYFYSIKKSLGENVSIDNTNDKVAYNESYVATLKLEEDFIFGMLIVTMNGESILVDKSTGVINIENVTGDIEIVATAVRDSTLFYEGYECEDITGGWTLTKDRFSYFIDEENCFHWESSSSSYSGVAISTNVPIDITGYNKLCCRITTGDKFYTGTHKLVINNVKYTTLTSNSTNALYSSEPLRDNMVNEVFEWDISQINDDSYYIGMASDGSGTRSVCI